MKIRVYKTITLPVVLYQCETWSLILINEHRVFENRVLRRTFGPRRPELIVMWRKLHNECRNLNFSRQVGADGQKM
jgi:hypothetical protein